MKMTNRTIPAALGMALLLCPVAAQADLMNGSLGPAGITATGQWNNSFTIAWEVTLHNLYATYKYTISGLEGKNLSHIILQVTGPDDAASIWDANVGTEQKTYSPSDPGNSNPGLPGSIYGVKFAGGAGDPFIITFNSDRMPTWGDFYAKDGTSGGPGGGVDVIAYNDGFGLGGIIDKISVPDTVRVPPEGIIPAPGAALLVGVGLGLVGWFKRRFA